MDDTRSSKSINAESALAVSDLGVGLLVQPLYITSLVMLIKENTQTLTFEITFHQF